MRTKSIPILILVYFACVVCLGQVNSNTEIPVDTFLTDYQSSVSKLKQPLNSIQGIARTRKRVSGAMSDWSQVEFFSKHGNVRVHENRRRDAAGKIDPQLSRALLWTPEITAIVLRPNSDRVWLDAIGETQQTRVAMLKSIRFDRYVAASFSSSDLDYRALFENGAFRIKSIRHNTTNSGWVDVSVQYVPEGTEHAISDIRFSFNPGENWAARKVVARSLDGLNSVVEVATTMREVPGVGLVVDQFEMKSYTDGNLQEHEIFELISCQRCQLSDDDFTLAALGVMRGDGVANKRKTLKTIAIVIGVGVVLLVVAMRYWPNRI